jgi:hypothetical protein
MAFLASSTLAIAFGAFLICAETCLHFESLLALPGSWPSLPIHDWLAGAFLVHAGVKTRRLAGGGRVYQVGAWAFSASLLCGAFFGHLEDWSSAVPADGWLTERALVVITALLLVLAVAGLVSTMVTTRWRRQEPEGM